MDLNEGRKKTYKFTIEFTTEADRDEFKNYLHHINIGTGIPIYKTVMGMMHLHKKEKKK